MFQPHGELVLSDIGQIEESRIMIEKLSIQDLTSRRRLSFYGISLVLIQVLLALALVLYIDKTTSINLVNTNIEFIDRTNSFLGIPYPVIIWGYLGSVTSMLVKFNNIYENNALEIIKAVFVRPVQALIMASLIYLILNSGFSFILGTRRVQESILNSLEFICVLSFVVGFSDRLKSFVLSRISKLLLRGSDKK